MADCTGGAGAAQRRHENSVRPLVMLKPQHQKEEKQQTIKEPTDAKWHILIDRLNKIVSDLLKDSLAHLNN